MEWPLQHTLDENGNPFIICSFDNFADVENDRDNTVIITDGWQQGAVAAILRGGSNAKAVLDVFCGSGFREIDIFHLEEKIAYLEDVFLSSVIMPAHTMFDNVTVNWRRDPSIYELLKKIGGEYDMLFFGAPLATSEILPFYRAIKECYEGSVTIIKTPSRDIEFDESDEIYKWVRRRTFEATDFALPSILQSHKKRLGKKVAVLLPSLNEEKTVGNVIKTALEVKDTGIIDEVILIDSQSSDNTVAIANSYGIPVFIHPQIKPDLGTYRGKGEAMYKSTFVTDADILAWIDTDIESITPRFFYGLLGPILTNQDILFSKGYYARPIRVDASGLELGGGRVTEIFARPWINAFIPQLSGFIQPLAGTVAIYRDLLVKMRLPANYGVEIAMLVQALLYGGLWSTCQVNLGEVVHKSKDVLGLGDMSFQILQVLIELSSMKSIKYENILRRVYSAHGHFEISSRRMKTNWRLF